MQQINTVFLKPQDLTFTHAGKEGCDKQILVFMTFDRSEEKIDRVIIQGCDLLFNDFWKNTGFRGIEADVSIQHSLLQCPVEDAVDVLYGLGTQCPFLIVILSKAVVEALNRVRGQLVKPCCTQPWFDMVSVAEVEKLAGGDGSGRIQR